ncbi:MAG: helix-turn-helix transcriptional regulator [Pseudomonadota bacterium]|uniref:helix-turn-helix domain-containing protein n=1 Tax=Methylophaga sp. TaxID=2024840 RepID=UPI002EC3D4E9|nr:helix-turn-helix transcriptional regulator [Pseudomonadota bacterium]
MDINRAFGKALREIRLSKGLSQEKMARAASRVYISSLERGLKSPTLITVEMIANELEIHPLTLLTLAYEYMESPEHN